MSECPSHETLSDCLASIWMSATLRLLAGFAVGGWLPVFYRRVHGMEPWEISIYLSVALTIGQSLLHHAALRSLI